MSENINGNLNKMHTFSVWCSFGVLSEFSRSSVGRTKKGKKNRNLNNRTFLPLSRSSILGNYTSHTGGRGGSPCPSGRDG